MSKNGIAVVVFGVEFALTAFGVEFEPGTVQSVVEAVALVGAFFLMVWHQIERRDTKWVFLKK